MLKFNFLCECVVVVQDVGGSEHKFLFFRISSREQLYLSLLVAVPTSAPAMSVLQETTSEADNLSGIRSQRQMPGRRSQRQTTSEEDDLRGGRPQR